MLLLEERVAEGHTKKPWKAGYRVIKVVGPLSYQIEHPSRRGRVLQVHVNRLKLRKPEYQWPEEAVPQGLQTDSMTKTTASVSESANRWIKMERARYRAAPRDHSPIQEEDPSDEEGQPLPAEPEPVPTQQPGQSTEPRPGGSGQAS